MLIVLGLLAGGAVAQVPAVPDFESEVLPVLKSRCFACHGPLRQRGSLRLDSRPAMLIGGGRGAAIVPGDAEASLLVAAIRREDELEMPPPRALEEAERGLLEAWIEAGAEWPPAHEEEFEVAGVAAREVPPVEHHIAEPGEPLSFHRDVRPILSDHCYECHGPDVAVRQAGLRLDQAESALGVLPSGRRALVPGSLDQSQLFQRIAASEPLDRMPPLHADSALSEREIEILGRFILQGAEFEDHWAYRPPRRPDPPSVTDRGWARGDLDRFVLARLESAGLAPAPEADRRTLARRLSLDLTGLPPTLMWRWRDWVIDAFNANQPFDEFTVDQLAGDLLPDPTPEQLLATGFHRNHMINFEGGAIPEEYRVQYVFDRTDTTATVWMGLTAGCAKCHDHKFDPISQREYYQLAAFFNTVDEVGLDGSQGNAEPKAPAPDPGQRAALQELRAELAPLDALLDDVNGDADAAQAAWQEEWDRRLGERWRTLTPVSLESTTGARMIVLDDGSIEVSGDNPTTDVYVIEAETDLDRVFALRLEALRDRSDPSLGIGRAADGSFVLTEIEVEATPLAGGQPRDVDFVDAHADYATPSLGPELAVDGNLETGWGAGYVTRATARTAVFRAAPPDAGDGGRLEPPHSGGARLRIVLRQESSYQHKTMRRFRLSVSGASDVAFQSLGPKMLPPPYGGLAAAYRDFEYLVGLPRDQRTEEQATTIRRRFRRGHWSPWRSREARYAELSDRLAGIEAAVPTTMVMREMDEPRPTFLLRRGEYDQQTDEVDAVVPAVLPPIPEDLPKNRLGLARWLVNGDHPLTARVTANRIWRKFFGRGLVATSGDFGSQGEWPSHPELLDWMATELVRQEWDLKALQKTIVMSSTYRQSSKATPELIERDPENRLLARASRFRLDAEVIRDGALAVSGLLVEKLGGPSVKPYQPPGLWREIGYESRGRFSAGIFEQDHGEALYRRSLYTFWKRTVPPPNMLVFDAPNRETCVVERSRSNTPLQALVLMNDPQFVEAARVLAENLLAENVVAERAEAGDAGLVDGLFRRVLARPATAVERQAMLDLVADLRPRYERDTAAARALLRVGERPVDERISSAELAAWSVAASAVLNLDEAVTRR